MKFFKYLIFLLLSVFSINTFADYKAISSSGNKSATGATAQQACVSLIPLITDAIVGSFGKVQDGKCWNSNGYIYGSVTGTPSCPANVEKFLDGYITPPTTTPPDRICYQKCIYENQGTWLAFDDTPNGNVIWGGTASSTGESCTTDTPKGTDTPNMKPEECRNIDGSDSYCNKPTGKACPAGYKAGSFNNKEICIKDSEKPTNPNDPNNESSNDKFDDTRIVDAINSSKKATVDAINNAVNSIKSSINDLKDSIKNVSDSVNSIGSSITNAVNGIGASINATLNANGDKVTNAVNKGTDATKDNGKKLDDIKNSIDDGNTWMKKGEGDAFPEDGNTKVDIKTVDTGNLSQTIFGTASQCPANKTLSMNFLGRTSFSYTFDFSQWCYYLGLIGNFILICAYIYASNIVLRS